MRIRFQPRRGTPVIELRDILGGVGLARWQAGDEREIAPGSTVLFQAGMEAPAQLDAATSIFRHGPDFVDAATGKNPLFACADCAADALAEHAYDYARDKTIPLVNAAGARLCVTCFLGRNPSYIVEFLRQGVSKSVIAAAQKLAADQTASFAPKPDDKAGPAVEVK